MVLLWKIFEVSGRRRWPKGCRGGGEAVEDHILQLVETPTKKGRDGTADYQKEQQRRRLKKKTLKSWCAYWKSNLNCGGISTERVGSG